MLRNTASENVQEKPLPTPSLLSAIEAKAS